MRDDFDAEPTEKSGTVSLTHLVHHLLSATATDDILVELGQVKRPSTKFPECSHDFPRLSCLFFLLIIIITILLFPFLLLLLLLILCLLLIILPPLLLLLLLDLLLADLFAFLH